MFKYPVSDRRAFNLPYDLEIAPFHPKHTVSLFSFLSGVNTRSVLIFDLVIDIHRKKW
jgi:hypothetical protein